MRAVFKTGGARSFVMDPILTVLGCGPSPILETVNRFDMVDAQRIYSLKLPNVLSMLRCTPSDDGDVRKRREQVGLDRDVVERTAILRSGGRQEQHRVSRQPREAVRDRFADPLCALQQDVLSMSEDHLHA